MLKPFELDFIEWSIGNILFNRSPSMYNLWLGYAFSNMITSFQWFIKDKKGNKNPISNKKKITKPKLYQESNIIV